MGASNMGASPATEVNHEDVTDLEKQHETNLLKPDPESEEDISQPVSEQPAQNQLDKWCGIVIIALIVFLGLFTLITWLAIRPVHSPRYYIDDIQIRSFAMNATDSTLAAEFAYTLRAENENKKVDFKYDWIVVDASYRGQNVGRGSVAGFTQGKTSNVTRTTEFSVQNVTLPADVTSSLAAAIANGSVPLRAFAQAKLHAKVGAYVSFPLNLNADCKLVVVPPSLTGMGRVASKECKLSMPRYKKAKTFKTYKPVTYKPIAARH